MKKFKKLKVAIAIIVFALFIWIGNTKVDAAVGYTRTFSGNDGSIQINLTGVTLDTKKAYSYALVTRGGTPEKWQVLTEYTANTAQVKLSSATKEIEDVLRVTDTGLLYIKDNSNDKYIVEALEVDLKLPYLQAFQYEFNSRVGYYDVERIYSKIGDTKSQTIQKVTDKTLIEQFLNVKNNGGNIASLEKYLTAHPTTGYIRTVYINKNEYNDGLYLVWVKLGASGCKDIYGCIIHDGLPEDKTLAEYMGNADLVAPTVKAIEVTSPATGTYKTSQTVKIRVKFSEVITGSSVPTLKIKFGESTERTVTNGTIKDNYIEYSYNIQETDKGQLAVVSLSGGSIKDTSGNEAKLSCPIISGYTIKANVDGTVNNNTDNQDKDNDKTDNDKKDEDNNTNKPTEDNKDNTQNGGTTNDQDKTVAPGKLPQTGLGIGIAVTIVAIVGIGALAYFKYNSYRDVK